MAGRTTLKLTDKDKAYLKKITRSRSMEARVVARAKILLHKAEGYTIDEIAQLMKIHRNTVILCLKKFNEGGVECALNDKPRKSVGRGHGISPEARDWVISIASREPQYAGLLDPSWSYEGLTSYISRNADKAGFPELESISKTSVRRILSSADNSTLKIRRNDMSQHRHDGEVQLSIPIDDYLSTPSQDWPEHGPGEQLSMSMMFDLYASDLGNMPEGEQPAASAVPDAVPAEDFIEEEVQVDEDFTEEDDMPEDEELPGKEIPDVEEIETYMPSLMDEDLDESPEDAAIIEDEDTEESGPSLSDEDTAEFTEETIAEPADAAAPEDAPEAAPVEDMPEDTPEE